MVVDLDAILRAVSGAIALAEANNQEPDGIRVSGSAKAGQPYVKVRSVVEIVLHPTDWEAIKEQAPDCERVLTLYGLPVVEGGGE